MKYSFTIDANTTIYFSNRKLDVDILFAKDKFSIFVHKFINEFRGGMSEMMVCEVYRQNI